MRNVPSRMLSALPGPLLVAAGPWSSGETTASQLSAADAVVAKTVTAAPREGNPPPVLRIARSQIASAPHSFLNRIGLRNVGAAQFVADRLPLVQTCGRPIIQSFTAQTEAEVEQILARLEPVSYCAYELNASCPNAPSGLLSVDTLRVVLRRARSLTDRPITVKLAYQTADELVSKARLCAEEGADALTAINTISALDFDPQPVEGQQPIFIGGLSGPTIAPLAQWAVHVLVREQSLPVIACGGIHSIAQVIAFAALGAAAVQVGSALLDEPLLVARLAVDLKEAYARWNVSDFSQLREVLCRHMQS